MWASISCVTNGTEMTFTNRSIQDHKYVKEVSNYVVGILSHLNFTLTKSNIIETTNILFSLIAAGHTEIFPLSMQKIENVQSTYSKLKKYMLQKSQQAHAKRQVNKYNKNY